MFSSPVDDSGTTAGEAERTPRGAEETDVTAPEEYTRHQAADPTTPQQTLADIAALRADLRPAVALNPAAYPGLLEWLATLGEPGVDAALRQRREGGTDPLGEPPAVPPAGRRAWSPEPWDVGTGGEPGSATSPARVATSCGRGQSSSRLSATRTAGTDR